MFDLARVFRSRHWAPVLTIDDCLHYMQPVDSAAGGYRRAFTVVAVARRRPGARRLAAPRTDGRADAAQRLAASAAHSGLLLLAAALSMTRSPVMTLAVCCRE